MQNKYRQPLLNPDESPPIDLRANKPADKRTRAETPLDFFVSPPDPGTVKHFLPLSQCALLENFIMCNSLSLSAARFLPTEPPLFLPAAAADSPVVGATYGRHVKRQLFHGQLTDCARKIMRQCIVWGRKQRSTSEKKMALISLLERRFC